MPASKPASSSRRTKELEAAARKTKAAPSQQVLKERRSKSAANVDVGPASCKRVGAFEKRGVLPAKKLSSTPSRPTTAGLAPSRRLAAEKKVDAIVEEARTKITAKQREEEEADKLKASAGGTSNQVVNPSPAVDPGHDLSVEDLEEAIYAHLTQADLAMEAMDTDAIEEQHSAAKEAKGRTRAESAAVEAAKAKSEVVAATALVQPSDASTAPSGAAGTPAGGVKRSSSGASAPSSKRLQRKPVVLGTRDG